MSSSNYKKMKQGTLFSFFTKQTNNGNSAPAKTNKPKSPTTAAPAAKPSPPATVANKSQAKPPNNLSVGTILEVYWPDDEEYYKAKVQKIVGNNYTLLYEDGEVETLDLAKEKYNIIDSKNSACSLANGSAGCGIKRVSVSQQEEEESEFELNDTEGEDDDDDVSMDLEDEEVAPSIPKNKKQKTSHSATASNTASTAQSQSNPLASFTSPKPSSSIRKITPNTTSSQKFSSTNISTSSSKSSPMSTEVNDETHLHHSYKFLKQYPPFGCRSIKIDFHELERKNGKKLTPAQQQWWDLKGQYFDCILLFKTGKFYEIFHMDADAAVTVCNFSYMKGKDAHCGFPEAAYATMSSKLVEAGYKVARVEQTETPAQLAIRKKSCKAGKKPQVVNREVCSILSKGTRTYNFMDGLKSLDTFNPKYLLSITEVIQSQNITDGRAKCEFGIAVVDCCRSKVILGQFADDILRSRMRTLLVQYPPSEILTGANVSQELKSLLKTLCPGVNIEMIMDSESCPSSTAIDNLVKKNLQRPSPAKPWSADETVDEIHRRKYFVRSKKRFDQDFTYDAASATEKWPTVLKQCVGLDGNVGQRADLALTALGGCLFYLQRCLIDDEVMRMGNMEGYVPPPSPVVEDRSVIQQTSTNSIVSGGNTDKATVFEVDHDHMELDGTTVLNLELLCNQDSTQDGTLFQKLNAFTLTPHGSRLLRAWMLRPMYDVGAINRRADAVQELMSGSCSMAFSNCKSSLKQCGDIERLLSRIHSLSESGPHPNNRAILYEGKSYNTRKLKDFRKLLKGLESAAHVIHCFDEVDGIESGLISKIVKLQKHGGAFPDSLEEEISWFQEHMVCKADNVFEPIQGMDEDYDAACEAVEDLSSQLEAYKGEMCQKIPGARGQWKYINTKPDSKDKYLIELPVSVRVPSDFFVKGKRGKGAKQVNKYSTPVTERLVADLDSAFEEQKAGKERGMQMIFAKFDELRSIWAAASHITAMLDALGALAQVSSLPGYSRPQLLDPKDKDPVIDYVDGFHPCIDITHSGRDFIPNSLKLGDGESSNNASPRVLLLSGPNMGGKSTLLRQTCLIAILAQMGCFVPAASCVMTPIDRIFTRLGASDKILAGQSTFFVELAETAAALSGATHRSLVIMDELGRGTSTFDGTAIAHATVKHLIENNSSLLLFATHYHSLLDDWKGNSTVKLGHMECMANNDKDGDHNITFLYTLGQGACPRSFGINVARLAALPDDVIQIAKEKSIAFENELSSGSLDNLEVSQIVNAGRDGNIQLLEQMWMKLNDSESSS